MARFADIIIAEQFAQSSVAYARTIAALEAEVDRLKAALKAAQAQAPQDSKPEPG